MKKNVELPIVEPIYGTYHKQGCGAATIHENQSVRNWYLNEAVNLRCNRKFLTGFTTPEVDVNMSDIYSNPYLYKYWIPLQFTKGYINPIIREMIDQGFYIYFGDFDDYYIEGKTWYKQRHFYHDGLICGYNQKKKTYCIYSYDNNWICQKFETSQKAFNDAREAAMKNAGKGILCAIKPSLEQVVFDSKIALEKIEEYLDSSLEKYPPTDETPVYGIVIHDYIAMYIGKLQDGTIPYEKMDWRVFRLIWEHKKVMQERLEKMEEDLELDSKTSQEYKKLVKEADTMRMLYASHHMKRRDSVLPIIQNKLLELKEKEMRILTEFICKAGGAIKECNYGE